MGRPRLAGVWRLAPAQNTGFCASCASTSSGTLNDACDQKQLTSELMEIAASDFMSFSYSISGVWSIIGLAGSWGEYPEPSLS